MDANKFGTVQLRLIAAAGFHQDQARDLIQKKFSDFASEDGKMTLSNFTEFLTSHSGLVRDPQRADHYFRAFDDRYHGHLLFNQFLTGLAALDPSTNHGSELGEIRSRYVFRFYCSQHSAKGVMGDADFRTLAKDIVKSKEPMIAANASEVNKRVGPFFQHFELDMNVAKFVAKIGSLQLRGTSGLFRAAGPVLRCLTQRRRQSREEYAMDVTECSTNKEAGVQTESDFCVSHSAVYVTGSGCVLERLTEAHDPAVVEAEMPTAVSQNTISILRQQQASDNNNDREKAISCAMDFLRGLDYFCRPYALKLKVGNTNPDSNLEQQHQDNERQPVQRKAALDWHDVEKPKLAACLMKLCRYLQPILAAEPRCLELSQPIYVLGDLHGNYEDLHEFERLFWPMGPENCIADILFLGDYVDRGQYGMEVVAYLFALKILAPKKVYLLRGNHELRDQQTAFSFRKECAEKLGDNGEQVWNAINLCFDRMPFAAIIDKKIFCVHGGIPHPRLLQRVPVPKNDLVAAINHVCPCPANTFSWSSVPWELMWNDPIWEDNATLEFDEHGFRPNSKRGTGHEFSSSALDAFLKQFGLSHIIRAHQVHASGFQIRYNAKCVTVFSSSMYSGLENEAAVVIINMGAIKLIRVSLRTGQAIPMEKENEDRQKDQTSLALSRKKVGLFAKR